MKSMPEKDRSGMLFNDSVQLRNTELVILNRSRRNYFNSIIFLVMR
jgi:hypothetical protein